MNQTIFVPKPEQNQPTRGVKVAVPKGFVSLGEQKVLFKKKKSPVRANLKQ